MPRIFYKQNPQRCLKTQFDEYQAQVVKYPLIIFFRLDDYFYQTITLRFLTKIIRLWHRKWMLWLIIDWWYQRKIYWRYTKFRNPTLLRCLFIWGQKTGLKKSKKEVWREKMTIPHTQSNLRVKALPLKRLFWTALCYVDTDIYS